MEEGGGGCLMIIIYLFYHKRLIAQIPRRGPCIMLYIHTHTHSHMHTHTHTHTHKPVLLRFSGCGGYDCQLAMTRCKATHGSHPWNVDLHEFHRLLHLVMCSQHDSHPHQNH